MSKKEELYDIIKKRFGTSDEDLSDLGVVMDALDTIEKAETLEVQMSNLKLENEKALKDLDSAWRERYRERFFTGDSDISDLIDRMEEKAEKEEAAADISIEEYLSNLDERGKYNAK